MDDLFPDNELLSLLNSVINGDQSSGKSQPQRFIPDNKPSQIHNLDILRTSVFTDDDLESFTRAHDKTAAEIGKIIGGMVVTADFSGAILTGEFLRSVPADSLTYILAFQSGRYDGFIETDQPLCEFLNDEIVNEIVSVINQFPVINMELNCTLSGKTEGPFLQNHDKTVFCKMSAKYGDKVFGINIGYDINLAAKMLNISLPHDIPLSRDTFYIGSAGISKILQLIPGKSISLPEICPTVYHTRIENTEKNMDYTTLSTDPFMENIRFPLTVSFSHSVSDIYMTEGEPAKLYAGSNLIASVVIRKKNGLLTASVTDQNIDHEYDNAGQNTLIPVYAELGRCIYTDESFSIGQILHLYNDRFPHIRLYAGSNLYMGECEAISCDSSFAARILDTSPIEQNPSERGNLRFVLAVRNFPLQDISSIEKYDNLIFNGPFTGDILIYNGNRQVAWGQISEQNNDYCIRVISIPEDKGDHL